MQRRHIIQQAVACALGPLLPLSSALERMPSEMDLDEDDAFRVQQMLDWAAKSEAKWFELVLVILDEFNPEVSQQETKRRLADWFEQIVKSLEECSYFAVETLERGAFRRKQPCLEALVRSQGDERPETVFLHTLDLLRLMFPVGYFQEDPQLSYNDRVSFTAQLNRIRRYHPECYRRLAETTRILNPIRFQTVWELWSSQNHEADGRDMQEGLALLRSEALIA